LLHFHICTNRREVPIKLKLSTLQEYRSLLACLRIAGSGYGRAAVLNLALVLSDLRGGRGARWQGAHLVTLLALDAGPRLGEATALDWRDVEWRGARCASARASHAVSHLGRTKVRPRAHGAMSRQLRQALRQAWMSRRVDHATCFVEERRVRALDAGGKRCQIEGELGLAIALRPAKRSRSANTRMLAGERYTPVAWTSRSSSRRETHRESSPLRERHAFSGR
jgi:integrase